MARSRSSTVLSEYPTLVSALNLRTHRARLRAGEMSDATGVDGRYTGAIRKHPGMTLVKNIGLTGCVNFWYVDMQKGTTDYLLRGWLVLYLDVATYKLAFHYYDTDVETWQTYTLTGLTLAATSEISVAGPLRFLYIAIAGQAPRVLYNSAIVAGDASAGFTHEQMGPGAAFDLDGDAGLGAPVAAGQASGGQLPVGYYIVGYRYYDSTRGIYSSISTRLSFLISTTDYKQTLTNPDGTADRAYDQGYDKLLIYRSMSASVGGSTYQTGLLHLETTYDLDAGADCWPATVEVGIVDDDQLFFADVYDPVGDSTGLPPNSGTIAFLEDVLFMGKDATAGTGAAGLKWSQLSRKNPEVFPAVGHDVAWDASDGPVLRFDRAGDMLFAFTENAAYRIVKTSKQLMITRMHHGRGVLGRFASASLGRDILAATPLGLSIFDGMKGTLQTIGAVDRLIFDTWVDDWDDLIVVEDSSMGCTYLINPAQEQAAAVWHIIGGVTLLDDCDWVSGCSGPDPSTGGKSRGFFLTAGGLVLTPDYTRAGTYTMYGLSDSLTLNGTNTSAAATYIIDTSATFASTMIGAYLYVFATDGTWEKRTISAVDVGNDKLTVSSSFGTTPSTGDRYAVSPVPFRLRLAPLKSAGPAPVFGRRVSRAMAVYSMGHTGVTGNDNGVWRVGMCRDLEDTPTNAVATITMDENPADQAAAVPLDGITLEPWIEHIAAETDFELSALGIDAIISGSRNVE